MLGSWTINPVKGMLPQKLASGWDEAFEKLLGAKYEPIVYVGSQVVNGTNHMIIAKQNRVTAEPNTAIVKVVLNEKAIDAAKSRFTIVSIDVLYENDGLMGGWSVVAEEPDAELTGVIADLTDDMMGAAYEPVIVAASQVVNGSNYKVLAIQTLVLASTVKHIVELTVNVPAAGAKPGILGIKNLV